MIKLDKKKVYDLSELNEDQLQEIYAKTFKPNERYEYLFFDVHEWRYTLNCLKGAVNAKELFYTLENVQVDCRKLTEEQIEEMCKVFEFNGNKYYDNKSYALEQDDVCNHLQFDVDGFLIDEEDEDKPVITYEKFMELFGEKENKSGWYKSTLRGEENVLVYIDFKEKKYYGLDYLNNWKETTESCLSWVDSEIIKATTEEVEQRLTEEATKRGLYNIGELTIECVTGIVCSTFDTLNNDYKLINNVFSIDGATIMKDGIWAKVIERKQQFPCIKEEKPEHYAHGIDTFERMEANCTIEECLAFAKGNIDKYNFRKKGQDKEDFEKIINYAKWALKILNK